MIRSKGCDYRQRRVRVRTRVHHSPLIKRMRKVRNLSGPAEKTDENGNKINILKNGIDDQTLGIK